MEYNRAYWMECLTLRLIRRDLVEGGDRFVQTHIATKSIFCCCAGHKKVILEVTFKNVFDSPRDTARHSRRMKTTRTATKIDLVAWITKGGSEDKKYVFDSS
eukprot:GEMP01168822.1.p1 GENE.GEMP01168822.1~~GEMP01168822.1.p1  ORF type:complete len:102 (+),score=9.31 GEMP01168822.1:2-307(+)